MINYIISLIFFSFIFSVDNSRDLLNTLRKKTIKWDLYDQYDSGKKIYQSKKTMNDIVFTKIEQNVSFKKEDIFSTIMNIDNYNNIISNKNISTKLIYSNNDTLYAYQKITNAIPFVRDRQYVFKIYKEKNKIFWNILSKNHLLLEPYLSDVIKTIELGAGYWEYDKSNTLINTLYVDDEVKMPFRLIQKIRINNTVNIFDDILLSLLNKKGDRE